MRPFDPLLAMLGEIPDPRRAEGKLYKLPYVLLFSILAVVTGGNSFRSIETFIKVHRRRLNAAFGLRWKRAPAHTAIRYILQGLDPQTVAQVFRRHAADLLDTATDPSRRTISLDGKTLKQSFDNFNDRKAAQVLHAFNLEAGLVLAHIEIDEKTTGFTLLACYGAHRRFHLAIHKIDSHEHVGQDLDRNIPPALEHPRPQVVVLEPACQVFQTSLTINLTRRWINIDDLEHFFPSESPVVT